MRVLPAVKTACTRGRHTAATWPAGRERASPLMGGRLTEGSVLKGGVAALAYLVLLMRIGSEAGLSSSLRGIGCWGRWEG